MRRLVWWVWIEAVGRIVLRVSAAIWGAGGALRGGVCGVRTDKIVGLARARALPVERLRERLVRVRSLIDGDGIMTNRS